MQIKELSQRTSLSAKTIRYYEEIGLLPPPQPLPNGYRVYEETAVYRIKFVVAVGARALGFSLDDIGQILALREEGEAPCLYVTELVERQLTVIDAKIAALNQLRLELSDIQRQAQTIPLGVIVDRECVCHPIQNQAIRGQDE
jgi:DNA-binding transcriptional MerR regulator